MDMSTRILFQEPQHDDKLIQVILGKWDVAPCSFEQLYLFVLRVLVRLVPLSHRIIVFLDWPTLSPQGLGSETQSPASFAGWDVQKTWVSKHYFTIKTNNLMAYLMAIFPICFFIWINRTARLEDESWSRCLVSRYCSVEDNADPTSCKGEPPERVKHVLLRVHQLLRDYLRWHPVEGGQMAGSGKWLSVGHPGRSFHLAALEVHHHNPKRVAQLSTRPVGSDPGDRFGEVSAAGKCPDSWQCNKI